MSPSLPPQLTLDLEPGLVDRHGSLLNCLAARVYAKGLMNVAGNLDMAPGNLSVALSGDGQRHFGVDHLERYIEKYQDFEPILYLISKFMGSQAQAQAATMSRVETLMQEAVALMAQAAPKPTKGRR